MFFGKWRRGRYAHAVCTAALLTCLLTACGDGGRRRETLELPSTTWARQRGDALNRGRGVGRLGSNDGQVRALLNLDSMGFEIGGATAAALLLSKKALYISTRRGLLAAERDGTVRWWFDRCILADSTVEVGSIVTAPVITTEDDLIVATERGFVFRLEDQGTSFTCLWVFPTPSPSGSSPLNGIVSSPAVRLNAFTLNPQRIFVATTAGDFLSINGNGTESWRFTPRSAPAALTSSPAVTPEGTVYVASPDGILTALDSVGRKLWEFDAGVPPVGQPLASPAVGPGTYVLAERSVVAVNADGTLRWEQMLNAAATGELAVALHSVTLAEHTPPSPTDPTPTITGTPRPTLTPTPRTALDTVVYALDRNGTVYGIRDSLGKVHATIKFGTAEAPLSADLPIIVSSEGFVILAARDGFLYASDLDGNAPCFKCDTTYWQEAPNGDGGRVRVESGFASQPVIDDDGLIYVMGANNTLYVVGTDPDSTRTPTPSPTPSPTA